MFEDALKGLKGKKGVKKWKVFGGKEANRWKKQGSVSSMRRFSKHKN